MKYLAVMHQYGEGCDYTIGCGTKVLYTDADNLKEAFENFCDELYWDEYLERPEEYEGNPLNDDHRLESMAIYEIGVTDNGRMYQNLYNLLEQTSLTRARDEQKRKDEAEFARLQKKLNK